MVFYQKKRLGGYFFEVVKGFVLLSGEYAGRISWMTRQAFTQVDLGRGG